MVHNSKKQNDMKSPAKKTIVTGVIVAALVLGGAGAAVAASVPSTPGGSSDATEQSPSFVGTVKAPAEAKDAAETTEVPDNAATEAADNAAETAKEAAETAATQC